MNQFAIHNSPGQSSSSCAVIFPLLLLLIQKVIGSGVSSLSLASVFDLHLPFHTMSSSGGVLTSPRAKIRRRRPALSCEQCRRRKIRCSQELPCKACVRSKSAMYCSYKDAGPPRPVESILSPEQSHTNSPSSSISRISSRSTHPATNRVESSSPQQKTLHRQKDNNVKAGARATAERPASNGFSVSPVLPRLRQMPEKTKMFGQNHWVHMADKVRSPTKNEVGMSS